MSKNIKPTWGEEKHLTWGGNLKSVGDEGILEGDAIVFGSEQSPDISNYKDFFTEETYVHPENEFVTALYMEHGFSYRKPIGKARITKSKNGWTAIAQLDMSNDVIKSRFPEIKKGGWGFSTGAVGHVVDREERKNGTHFITQWSVGELSLTRTPAEPKALIHTVKSLDEYYTLLASDDLEEPMEQNDSNQMNSHLMKIIEMLISEIAKKHIEDYINPQLEEIKNKLSLPIGSEVNNQELTVLKTENEDLKSSINDLQSSFNEKEALLSEKMVLLSETQAELEELKTKDLQTLEDELVQYKTKIAEIEDELEKTKKTLNIQKEANRVLTQSKLKK